MQFTTGQLKNIEKNLGNEWYRLNHLYHIVDPNGVTRIMKWNKAQKWLYDNLHSRNIILKSRQRGFTTAIQALALDRAIWNKNFNVGIIAHRDTDAKDFFRRKIKFMYDRLLDFIKEFCPAKSSTEQRLHLDNGSSIHVSMTIRSGTINFLHISELAYISQRDPQRAREIRLGGFPAVPPSGTIVIESTNEGEEGVYAEQWHGAVASEQGIDAGADRTPEDWKPFFFPSYERPENRYHGVKVDIPERPSGNWRRK